MTSLTKILLAASFVAGIPVQGATEINYWLLEKAGVDSKSLWDLNWNPKDGGTFGQLLAKLSINALFR